MKRTIITVGGNGMLSIPSNLENLWMSESELVDMLYVTAPIVRKIVQDNWKLQPSENALTYTSYEYNYNNSGHYSPTKRVGRFYT